jgi:hypothetical protein
VAAATPIVPKMIATVPEAPKQAPPVAPEIARRAPEAVAVAPAPPVQRAAALPLPPPANPPAVSTEPAVRTMAFPAMTAPKQAPSAAVQSASFVVTNVRDNDVLNVRAGPSTEFDIVASLKPGSRGVAITGDCQSEWCPVRHQNASGWVNSSFLSNEAPTVVQAALRVPGASQPSAAVPAKTPFTAFRDSPEAPRTCLTQAARALLQTIEAKFGPVKVVSTCRAGATIAGTGRPSRHASGNAVDFNAGPRKGEILRWLIANHKAGGVMTYPDMDHIHVDIGQHFVSIAGGQNSASWRGERRSRGDAQDDD